MNPTFFNETMLLVSLKLNLTNHKRIEKDRKVRVRDEREKGKQS